MSRVLDTNSFIDHLRRGAASNVTARLIAAPPGSAYLCSVVLAELFYGAMRSSVAHQAVNLALIAALRQQFVSLPFDDRAAEEYGKVRAHLAAMGTPIGPNDLMIAATALANRMTLVTHNTAEFSRVPGLNLEDRNGGRPGGLLVVQEAEEVTVGMVEAELIGCLLKVAGVLLEVVDVDLDGPWGAIAEREVFDETLAQGRHGDPR